MKARVIKNLQGGTYYVSFTFSDFTPEELAKMQAFGVPIIQIRLGPAVSQSVNNFQINQINQNHVAGFPNEEAAKSYENGVLTQVKAAMEKLRQQKDTFSATTEVDI